MSTRPGWAHARCAMDVVRVSSQVEDPVVSTSTVSTQGTHTSRRHRHHAFGLGSLDHLVSERAFPFINLTSTATPPASYDPLTGITRGSHALLSRTQRPAPIPTHCWRPARSTQRTMRACVPCCVLVRAGTECMTFFKGKNQGSCGSCYAFATVTQLEMSLCVKARAAGHAYTHGAPVLSTMDLAGCGSSLSDSDNLARVYDGGGNTCADTHTFARVSHVTASTRCPSIFHLPIILRACRVWCPCMPARCWQLLPERQLRTRPHRLHGRLQRRQLRRLDGVHQEPRHHLRRMQPVHAPRGHESAHASPKPLHIRHHTHIHILFVRCPHRVRSVPYHVTISARAGTLLAAARTSTTGRRPLSRTQAARSSAPPPSPRSTRTSASKSTIPSIRSIASRAKST